MEYVVEAASFSLREFLLGLVERLELARVWLYGGRHQHDAASFGENLKFVAIVHVELPAHVLGERNGEFAAAHSRPGHVVLLVLLAPA
jgi:hypothetical protein